jgi:high-affinity iron transporter
LPTSWLGTFLKGIFNFSPATTWLQLTVWVLYLVPTMFFFLRRIRSRPAVPATAPAVAAN